MLRSLQLAGIPTYVACPASDQTTRSRWYRPIPGPTAWDGRIEPNRYDILRTLPIDEAVLIAGADDAALWLSSLPRDSLSERFFVSSSTRETQEILQDKGRFARFLASTDMPHPRTFSIDCRADIDAIPYEELDRVFIKPVNSQEFSDVTGAKGIWTKNRKELVSFWQQLDGEGFRLMAQEYVPGSASDHYFIDGFRDRNGNVTGLLARRRYRIYPPDFGNSSYCESIALADIPQPVAHLTRLLETLSYRGIFSAEFKRDARDGQYRILEINTRAWTYVEFATRCGVNVCEMAYQDAIGLPVKTAPTEYAVGEGCVDLYKDINCVRVQASTARGSLVKILGQWARAHFHSFRMDDPGPAMLMLRRILGRHLGRNSGTRDAGPG